MADQEVKYTLSLNDLLTGKIKEADGAAQHMEGTLHSAGEKAAGFGKELIGALGVGFAIFKGVEFVKESVEDMRKLADAQAQVRAGLESTRSAAGMTFEALEDSAKEMTEKFKYTQEDITDMQAQLLTFPSVTKATFGEASQSILDMSTRLHKGLNDTAIMVGKALQDPAKGITALRRVGVNFNETQTAAIQKMAETGHMAQAQKAILQELQTEFAGSAKAAADADPLFRFDKIMESIRLEVGDLAIKLLHYLTPALVWVASAFKNTLDWMKEHSELLKAIAIGVAIAVAVYLTYELVINAVAIATKAWEGAQWLLNAALDANPIGIVVVAIAAFVTWIVYAYEHCAKFRAVLWATWAVIKEFGSMVADVFKGLYKLIHGVFTFNLSEIKSGLMSQVNFYADAAKRLGNAAAKGYSEGLADFAKDQAKEASPKTLTKKGISGAAGVEGAPGKNAGVKGTGSKSITINIKIDSLVKSMTYNVKNASESASKLKEIVVQTLLSAVNDSQIVAGE